MTSAKISATIHSGLANFCGELSGPATFCGGKNKFGLPACRQGRKPVPKDLAVHRIIDANLNRCREALRVCEDITRFVLDDKALTWPLKQIRHRISKIADRLPDKVINARDIEGDIGRDSSFDKIKAVNIKLLFYKNIHKAEESIRALEEFSKLSRISGIPRLSADFKALRFRVYAIEKKAIKRLQALCSN